jgi:hypothetical protein
MATKVVAAVVAYFENLPKARLRNTVEISHNYQVHDRKCNTQQSTNHPAESVSQYSVLSV